MNKYIRDFLRHREPDDVAQPVKGELLELSTHLATYTYGNGELFIAPVDDRKPELTYFADRIGFDYQLVEG